MKIPVSWLSEFIDLQKSPEEIAEIFTMGGIEVEAVEDPYQRLGEIISVKIIEVLTPEDLKEVALCKVTDGKQVFTVFTTAKDQVKPGLILALAKPGSNTFSGENVEVKKVKKYQSEGMFLSPYEAGTGPEKEVLLVLPEGSPLGRSVYEILGINETVLELAVTPNRGDVLSVLGAARELHLLTSWELKPLFFEDYLKEGKYFKGEIKILEPEGCFRYIGRTFENVQIGESPFYIQKRLWECGLRPINNVVDITNYVLLELGQPLHAFDWDKINGHTIIVRRAYPQEKLMMLDGIERTLTEEDLVIADAEKALVLAGIMGGEESGVSEETKNLFLEAAWFNHKWIRMSSQRHKVSTESSYRFERNIDPEGIPLAVLRATQMILETAKAERFSEMVDLYPKPYVYPQIVLSQKKVTKYLGFSLPVEEIKGILSKVGEVRSIGDSFEVKPFSYRQDLKIPEDLIEEIARVYGYEKIPTTFPKADLWAKGKSPFLRLEEKVKELFRAFGFFEVITYSFIDPKDLDRLHLDPEDLRSKPLEIANPLSSNQSVMRTTLIPGLLRTACFNFFREVNSLAIFETGKVFIPNQELLPDEPLYLGFLLMGQKNTENWYGQPEKFDIYDLKGVLEEFFEILTLEVAFKPYSEEPFLKRGLSFDLYLGEEKIGFAGEVKTSILKSFDLKTNVLVGEINLEKILKIFPSLSSIKKVKKPPKFPSTTRDVTCVVDRNFEVGEILAFIKNLSISYLEKVSCVKVYEGPPIPEGQKSVSLRFWYRAEDRTLTDEEVNHIQDEVAKKIFDKFNAKPR